MKRIIFCALLAAVLFCLPIVAQVSGRLTGAVLDQSSNAIAGATITLKNLRTGEVLTAKTNEEGIFSYLNIPPSAYTLRIEAKGFKSFEKSNIILSANQILSLGNLSLVIGEVTEVVQVEAQGAAVQVDNSGQNSMLSDTQMKGLMGQGRDVVTLLKILPGVAQNDQVSADSIGGTISGSETPNFSGTRSHWNSFKLDGQPGQNIDAVSRFSIPVSWDTVEEVVVKTTSYLPEDGRAPGVNVNVISKSGSSQFHGSGYWFKRHEMFNATNFFNNRQGLSKPVSRFDTLGGTLGGPVVLPSWLGGNYNQKRDKLFFFVSQENWRVTRPDNIRVSTVPTDLERRGDFSQSRDQNNALIVVRDPLTGQPFANNIIPTARLKPIGQAMLNFIAPPNALDRNITKGAYNHQFQEREKIPKYQTAIKIDFTPTTKDRISFRGMWFEHDRQSQNTVAGVNANFTLQPHHYIFGNRSYLGSYTRTITPSVVNELNVSIFRSIELGTLTDKFDLSKVRKEAVGLGALKQLFPTANPLNLVPNMVFGGLSNSASFTYDGRLPIAAGDERYVISDNLSWAKGTHTMKFGFFYELQHASEGPRSVPASSHGGRFDFGRNANNPNESNHPFANALLGNFFSYSESSGKSVGLAKMYTVEGFLQDSWKVTPRFNLDFGVRLYTFTPWRLREDEGSALSLQRFSASKVPQLYLPACVAVSPCSGANRVAKNPVTGQVLPSVLIGAIVPGTGDRLNGLVLGGDASYPDGWRERPPLQVAPRAGFAWDVLGNAKTVVRGGMGVSKQAVFSSQDSMWIPTTSPPILESPTIFFSNLDTFLGAGQTLFPAAEVRGFDIKYDNVPTVYNWSLGVQRDIGFGTVMDVSYVGNTARHLRQRRQLNTLAPGARFLPSSLDPTTNRPLPDTFLRPYKGYQTIEYVEDSGYSNYHGLQIAVNRRYARSVQYGVAYTWSKAMGLADQDNAFLPQFSNYRTYLYGKLGFDQTHVLVANYLWSLPNAQALGGNFLTRGLFHGWDMAGIATFASGFPQSINFSYTDGVDRHGGGDAPRVIMNGNPLLERGERSFSKWFNTAAFKAPGVGNFGNAPRDVFRGPGSSNLDITLAKNFRVTEKSRIQFRWEVYNLFNHTQFRTVDNNARFDANFNQINTQFGQVTATRQERQMQMALRFEF